MQKIISLFQRNYDGDRLVRDEIVPGAEWVLAGEGVATEKFDGTACLARGSKLYKRYDAKRGKRPPEGFIPAEPEPNEHTGHWPGWVPVGDGPEDQWHREAWAAYDVINPEIAYGTYELVGPKVQGNPYGLDSHRLWAHGSVEVGIGHVTFESVRDYLSEHAIEGIVWHHPNGRMVKIKARDFGIKWPR